MNTSLTRTERVIQKVRELILSGEYTKGDILPSENQLSEMAGVSRVTTRKALATLTDMGLIETRRGVGSFVIVDPVAESTGAQREQMIDDFRNKFSQAIQIKRLIDPEIAKHLALHASKKDIDTFESALAQMEQYLHHNPHFSRAGHDFHMAFIKALNNPTLTELYDKLETMESPYSQISLLAQEAQAHIKKIDLEQHREILKAIKTHDQDRAYYLTKVHLEFFDAYYGNMDQ